MATIKSWDTTDQLHVDTHHSAQVTILDAAGNPIDATHPLAVVLQGNGTVSVSDGGGSLTVDGQVNVGNFPASQAVTGPLTDTQLRAAALPVTGPLTDVQIRASALPTSDARLPAALDADGGVKTHVQNFPASQTVTGPLTDAQLRATAVPVSGPLTDAQLRASAVPTADSRLPAALDADGGLKAHIQNSVTIANPTAAPETGLAKDATLTTRLPAALDADGGVKTHVQNSITVANPTANPETGLAKDATLTTRLPAALDADGGVKTHVQNFPASQVVTGPLTDAQLRASSLPVTVGNFPASQTVTGPLTDAQLRAAAVPVSVGNFPASQVVTGPLTDAQLRASALPVSVGNFPASQVVTGPLTDAQLRASAVPVTVGNFPATQPVSGPLTDAQLRATPVKETPTSPGGLSATVTAYGNLRITAESHAIFADSFDSASIDTANRWNYNASGQQFATSGGLLSLAGTTTASNFAGMTSQPTMSFPGVNYLAFGALVKMEAALVTGNHRFIGMGTTPGTFAAATPIQDGIGFEIGTDGRCYAVVYKSSVRVFAQDVTASLVAGNYNRYGLAFRTDAIIFYINSLDVPVASFTYTSAGFAPPDNLSLPVRFHSINGTGAVSAAPAMQITAVGVGDTGANASQIADANYPWRKAVVNSLGQLATARYPGVRTMFQAYAQTAAVGATANTEVQVPLTPVRSFVTGTAANTLGPSAGKTLRLTDMLLVVRAGSASIIPMTARLRVNPTGAAGLSNTLVAELAAVNPVATLGSLAQSTWNWDDSIDLTGAMQFTVTLASSLTSVAGADIIVNGYEF